jgi:hypothetical protein
MLDASLPREGNSQLLQHHAYLKNLQMDEVKKSVPTLVMLCSFFCQHLAMKALVLLHIVQFRMIWFGA